MNANPVNVAAMRSAASYGTTSGSGASAANRQPAGHGEAASVHPLLELRNIAKQFPGVRALDGVTFAVHAGEVHMLLGENGAGKSTLMKVMSGVYRADEGAFLHNGQPVVIQSPKDAQALGVAVIYQEFSLVPHLDIAQNIYIGREFRGRLPGTVDNARAHEEAKKVLDLLAFDCDPHTPVHKLGVAQQQMVEIAKALSQNARILVMDEPTAPLSERETENLFRVIRMLQSQGVAIVYISHRMSEVFELGDRITVLRDGRMVGAAVPSETTPAELVRMMVGRDVDLTYARRFCEQPGAPALVMRGVSSPNGIRDVNLEVRAGEIVGLAGLVGSGRSEVARAAFGIDPVSAGEVEVFGQPRRGEPHESVKLGMALIPESRKHEGLAVTRSVADNLMLSGLAKRFPGGWFRPRLARQVARDMVAELRIATPTINRRTAVLSGGNQQKIVIGKWLATGTRLFIFDEPTRGIDVGAKAEIFALIGRLVEEGAAVLLISSELPEIVHVCDRAYVMREGRVAGQLSRDQLSEENLLALGMHDA
ncbi:MAG: sugar ABC transporter ATP-binding protein [Pseudomonadota bacterium]|jgi:ribose transport system ATP-binding protein|uniref:sugar ABC transporter ATP-binding protein n=1 Tax=Burkholderiaceae TaxID=119060 RepID=UPI002017C054|nr:sugar ABC transporter ATP-binding protein [Burkholderia sp. 4M9327F10]